MTHRITVQRNQPGQTAWLQKLTPTLVELGSVIYMNSDRNSQFLILNTFCYLFNITKVSSNGCVFFK